MTPSRSNRIAVGPVAATVAPVAAVATVESRLGFVTLRQPGNRYDLLARVEADQAYPLRVAAAAADLRHAQANHFAPRGDQHELIFVRHHQHAEHRTHLAGDTHPDAAFAAALGDAIARQLA